MSWTNATLDEIDRGFDHLGGLESAAQAELCTLIQEVDSRQSWMGDGARNLSDWVATRLRVRAETARDLVSMARRLVDLPLLHTRFAAGALSIDQVDAISRMATPETEQSLIEEAMRLSNHALDRMARRSRPPSPRDERTTWQRRSLSLQWNLDESELRMRGLFGGADGEIVQSALESAADRFGPNPDTGMFDPYRTRLADAMVEIAATSGGGVGTPPQITLHADLEALTTRTEGVTELEHGALVPNETARRLACDAVVEVAVERGAQVIGIGRNSRTIPGWLRRQLHYRDGGVCQFPDCRHTRWLHGHHRQHWALGGPTDLDNLILLCGYHHRFVHEHGWHITGGPGPGTVFRLPDWRPYPHPRQQTGTRVRQLVADRSP